MDETRDRSAARERGGETVIVTGGSSGLGAAIARTLHESGHCVFVADLVPPPAALGSGIEYVHTDLTKAADVERLVETARAAGGRITGLVNSAGIWFRKPFLEIDAAEWDRVCAVNLRAPFLLTRSLAPVMAAEGGGAIVNIGSQAGLAYTRGQGAHYHASKAGLVHLTRVLAFELGPMNIRINCVAPGAIARPGSAGAPADEQRRAGLARIESMTPLARLTTVEEIVSTVIFLLGPGASGITGQTLLVNGGAIAYL